MKEKLLKLAKLIMKFAETKVGDATWTHEGDLAVGVEVYVQDEQGEFVPVADGEYIVDEKKVKVEGGKVVEIEVKEPEQPEQPEEMEKKCGMEGEEPEPAPAEPEKDEKDLRIEELEGLLADRDAVIEELTAKVKELEDKLVKPVEEPVQMAATPLEKMQSQVKENKALKYFE